MKILFILDLLAFTAFTANATHNMGQQHVFPHQQPTFSHQWQQPIPPQQQQPCQQEQQTFPQPWQQPFWQPWQQTSTHQQQQQQQQQQQFLQQPPFTHPSLQQQLNPCRDFLLQQCSPLARPSFPRSQMVQQSSCEVMRQQCCQQLAQIPVQFRYRAIHNVVHTVITQQQQQMGQGSCQPQQQQLGQAIFFQPQQLAQFQVMQTLSTVCNVNVPLPQFGDVSVGVAGS